MGLFTSPEDLAVQEGVREMAEREIAPFARAADESRSFDRSRLPHLAKAGCLGACIPKIYGGSGWSHVQTVLAMIELGARDSSWRGFCTVQALLCGQLLLSQGSEEQKKENLPRLVSGEWIFAYALTEPEAGTDVASLACEAVLDGDGYRITGTKHWISNGGIADRILVFATVDRSLGKKGITCFLVPGDAPGLGRRPVDGIELGHRGSDHAILDFRDVRVPKSAVVGAEGRGFDVAMSGLAKGRLGVAAGAVGIQQGCVDACIRFARERRQFGQRIGDFQLVQEALTDMHVGLSATRLLTLQAAALADAGSPHHREVSVAKYAACEAAVRTADAAVLLHGARGYSSAYPLERMMRDAKGLQIYEGTSHIQKLIIARDLLGPRTDPKKA